MGQLGFSYIGLIFLLLLIIPNLIWAKVQIKEYAHKNESKILLIVERVGQALVVCTSLIFADFNPRGWSAWTLWLIAAAVFIFLYELWWIRYFKSQRTDIDFYSSFLGIPLASAVLPVIAFFLLGIYGKVLWLMISTVIFGIGHIGIHLQHRRNTSRRVKDAE
jgi:hypothetical protein